MDCVFQELLLHVEVVSACACKRSDGGCIIRWGLRAWRRGPSLFSFHRPCFVTVITSTDTDTIPSHLIIALVYEYVLVALSTKDVTFSGSPCVEQGSYTVVCNVHEKSSTGNHLDLILHAHGSVIHKTSHASMLLLYCVVLYCMYTTVQLQLCQKSIGDQRPDTTKYDACLAIGTCADTTAILQRSCVQGILHER